MRFRKVFWILLIVVIVSFITSKVIPPFRYLSYPFDLVSSLYSRISSSTKETLMAIVTKKSEIKRLKEERDDLLAKIVDYENLRLENKRLTDLLKLKEEERRIFTFARVIRRGIGRWSNTLVIDKGNKDGVKKDMSVMTSRGLVGKVISVNEYSSEVMLLNDSLFRVSVRLMNSRAEGIASGEGRRVVIKYIPLEVQNISNNEPVITSGLDGLFPPGIPVGYITSIKDGQFFKEIQIKPFQDMFSIEEVAILNLSGQVLR